MPDFTYASFTVFRESFGFPAGVYPVNVPQSTYEISGFRSATGGTIEDPQTIGGGLVSVDNNGAFDINETITIDAPAGANTVLTFEGVVEIGGVIYPVFVDSLALPGYYVFSQDVEQVDSKLTLSDIQDMDGAVSMSFVYPNCFAGGTRIATPCGERRVEALSIGDEVLTADGRAIAVRWIGRQSMHTGFAKAHRLPIRIEMGALGGGLPRQDLVVTADHGMILDGFVVNASALVNGTSIQVAARESLPEHITYYHIETEGHEVILAEGAEAETFVDYQGREAFDNYAEYVQLYGSAQEIPELGLPRITCARMLPASVRARLSKAAGRVAETVAA